MKFVLGLAYAFIFHYLLLLLVATSGADPSVLNNANIVLTSAIIVAGTLAGDN